MSFPEPVKCFSTQEDAQEGFILLEAHKIPCEVKKQSGDWFYTLYVTPEHAKQADELLADFGFSLPEADPATEPEETPEVANNNLGAIRGAMRLEEKSLRKKLTVLIVSLLIFAGMGLVQGSPVNLLLILLVLFIHESGHWLGMKLFKYKDVQMFFIPGFGAAVSGTETAPNAKQKAIISLMGPVPGILVGIGCLIAYLITRIAILSYAADLFIIINAFNLLPFTPLDGGRFLEAVLFTRHPKAEIVFKTLALAGIAGIAYLWKSIGLGLLAYFTFISIKQAWTIASVSASLRKELPIDHSYTPEDIPDHFLEKIITRLDPWHPQQQNEIKRLAQSAKTVWAKMIIRHCSIRASIGLTLLYLLFATPSLGLLTISQVLARRHPAPAQQTPKKDVTPTPDNLIRYNIYPTPEK